MTDYARRFWGKVCIGSEDECWNWLGHLLPTGHGQFAVNRKHVPAHRYALNLYVDIPDGSYVCHKCDNASCVNPRHLYLGSHADNMKDRARTPAHYQPDNSGEKHGMAKLSTDAVQEIKVSLLPQRKLAKIFGISQTTVYQIKKGRTWRHVA